MKSKRIILVMAGLLVLAACSEEATAPDVAPQARVAPIYDDTPVTEPAPDELITRTVRSNGVSWTVSVGSVGGLPTTRVLKNGQQMASFNAAGFEVAGGRFSATAWEGNQVIASSSDVPVLVEDPFLNMMASDIPCDPEIRALVSAAIDFSNAALQLRGFPSVATFTNFAYQSGRLYLAAQNLVKCLEKVSSNK